VLLPTWALASLVALAADGDPPPAPAAEPEVLAIAGRWVINYDTDACHLLAQFGTDDRSRTILRLSTYSPGDLFDVALLGRRFYAEERETDLTLDFGIRPDKRTGVMTGTTGGYAGVYLNDVRLDGALKWDMTPITAEQIAAVRSVTVQMRGKRAVRLMLGSLVKPMASLRLCTDDLIRSWGFDPEEQAHLSRRAVPTTPVPSWFSDKSYPMAALRAGITGMLRIRIGISPEGKMTGCDVVARFKPDPFSDLTCDTVRKKGSFVPALSAAGQPVASFLILSFRYQLTR
jgi:hypothetical protein